MLDIPTLTMSTNYVWPLDNAHNNQRALNLWQTMTHTLRRDQMPWSKDYPPSDKDDTKILLSSILIIEDEARADAEHIYNQLCWPFMFDLSKTMTTRQSTFWLCKSGQKRRFYSCVPNRPQSLRGPKESLVPINKINSPVPRSETSPRVSGIYTNSTPTTRQALYGNLMHAKM